VLINRDIQKFQFHFIFKAIDLMFYIPMRIISRLGDHEEFLLSAYERVGLFFSSKFSKNNSGSKIPISIINRYKAIINEINGSINNFLLIIIRLNQCTCTLYNTKTTIVIRTSQRPNRLA
jgi:hypothetical protein